VKQTVLDARKAGFDVTVVADAIAAINVHPGDDAAALAEMKAAGAHIAASVADAARMSGDSPPTT
jgi:nicotinamidase/pyrazinamidase